MSELDPNEEPRFTTDIETQIDQAFAAYLQACDRGEVESREDFLHGDSFPGDDDAETIGIAALGPHETDGDLSGLDPHATLPVANRPRGDSGPSLPF
mgnify:CR=1 FL=1